ncbi:hypothetical protein DFJ74DRAFT_463139 [Hyaloraphidium curvatum]|nr:hypothetical protein DFJ74DRAFT_463139 [Hyaloraphidium curvatum]
MWVWGGDVTGDAFGRRQMVAGTVAVILTYLVGALGPLLLVARTPGTGMGYPSDLDLHAWAGIARWLQLVSRAGDAEAGTASQLVAHDADDPSCPCGLPECAGKLPRSAAWIQAGYRGTLALVVSLVQVFIIWTPLVHYGPQLAATAWGIALVALFCVTAANFAPFFFCNVEPNVASVGLAVRVQHRAMRLALSSFLGRCGAELRFRAKDGALTTPQEGTEAPDARAELHFRLHSLLAASWAVAVEPSLYDKVFISFNLAGQLVVAVIYVVGSRAVVCSAQLTV